MALRIAEEGGKVLCAGISADGAADTAGQIEALTGEAAHCLVYVSDPAAVDGWSLPPWIAGAGSMSSSTTLASTSPACSMRSRTR